MDEELIELAWSPHLDWQDVEILATKTDCSLTKKALKDIATMKYHQEEYSAELM